MPALCGQSHNLVRYSCVETQSRYQPCDIVDGSFISVESFLPDRPALLSRLAAAQVQLPSRKNQNKFANCPCILGAYLTSV